MEISKHINNFGHFDLDLRKFADQDGYIWVSSWDETPEHVREQFMLDWEIDPLDPLGVEWAAQEWAQQVKRAKWAIHDAETAIAKLKG